MTASFQQKSRVMQIRKCSWGELENLTARQAWQEIANHRARWENKYKCQETK